ncbi:MULTISPECIES: hypothetical protein [unclassified Caballeronia]|uniref:hypothetical protein n=1 Tax=unclassified Caballeronia TaxID=2646786 RepID=UPI0028578411|nr:MULTISPECIES: hypothetical protein [unclassified Caballeronia]MDR5741346.1 hypothetical protein [Caballeronia sp. LZ016]MDR5807243.1 hypothetical protein [Caballeronia sp. LZ019]
MTSNQHYRGYAVHPFAHRLGDNSFSANVLLERAEQNPGDTDYQFYSLDYFPKEADAIAYSSQWAREWIDTRG